jgi:hypothetical protein
MAYNHVRGLADKEVIRKLEKRHHSVEGRHSARGPKAEVSGDSAPPDDDIALPEAAVEDAMVKAVGTSAMEEQQGTEGMEALTFQHAQGPPAGSTATQQTSAPGDAAAGTAAEAPPSAQQQQQQQLQHGAGSGAGTADDECEDEADVLQYEWQFDLLNNLPREKGVALVNHLRHLEQERAKASRMATRLSGENAALGRRLSDGGLSSPGDSPSEISVKRRCCRMCGIVAIDVAVGVLLVTGLLVLYATIYLDDDSNSHWLWQRWMLLMASSIGNAGTGTSEAGLRFASKSALTCDAAATLGTQLQETQKQLEDCETKLRSPAEIGSMAAAKVGSSLLRETAMKEMLQDAANGDYNPEEIAQLRREHAEMKIQLEKIWMDVKAAAESGQDMVCWNI